MKILISTLILVAGLAAQAQSNAAKIKNIPAGSSLQLTQDLEILANTDWVKISEDCTLFYEPSKLTRVLSVGTYDILSIATASVATNKWGVMCLAQTTVGELKTALATVHVVLKMSSPVQM